MFLTAEHIDGRIICYGKIQPEVVELVKARYGGELVVEDLDDSDLFAISEKTHMVQNGRVVPRPECPETVLVMGRKILLGDLPPGTAITVTLSGFEPIETSETEIELDEPGRVQISLTPPWPYREKSYDIDVE